MFDPQGVARTPQTWWWDPLAGITTVEEAERLAGHFIAEVEDEKDSIWSKSATELLSGLLLAANLTRSTITQVYKWLADEHDPAPVAALEAGGFDVLAGSLRGCPTPPPRPGPASTSPPAPGPAACATRTSPPGSPHHGGRCPAWTPTSSSAAEAPSTC